MISGQEVRIAAYVTRTTCRTCNGVLADVLDFGMHPVPDFTQRTPEDAKAVARAPLTLARCEGCGLVQLRHTVERSTVFGQTYPYRSGVNATMRAHLRGIVEQAMTHVEVKAGDFVVDIGANDGTLLRQWPEGVRAYGFEPSLNLARACWDAGLSVVSNFFDADAYLRWAWPNDEAASAPLAKVVTSVAMFYDLDDPLAFCRGVARILAPDGVWINEFNYLPTMVDRVAFDMVGHEHLAYYGLWDIVRLYGQAGLTVFSVETNAMNGGSLRVLAGRADGEIQPAEAWTEEGKPLEWLVRRVAWNREKTMAFLGEQARQGKRVYLYGASTRGLTILHHYGIDESLVVAAADRNPDKWGCYIPGTGIPIVSEEEFRANADVGLVLPYTFIEEFRQREMDWLRRGGTFVIPLPRLQLVGAA